MTRLSRSRSWMDTAGVTALPLALGALGLALACAGTGAARPQTQAPVPQAAPSSQAAGPVAVAPAGAAPSVQVAGGESFSFGAFWPGEALKHTFTLKNAGGAELKILRVQPG